MTRPVQEDELHAYVDERLDPERHAEIETMLARDPALRRRIEDWQAQRSALRGAFAFKATEPVPRRLAVGRLIEHRAARTSRGAIAAGIALALMVGAAAGWSARGLERPGEVARIGIEATAAHRVFAADLAHPVEMGPTDRAELVSWISRRLGRPIEVPDLTRLGYRFLGGRVVSAGPGPAGLLMYEDDQGNRITVFVLPMKSTTTAPLQPVRANATGGYAWIANRIGYSVISAQETPAIETLAEQVRTEMR